MARQPDGLPVAAPRWSWLAGLRLSYTLTESLSCFFLCSFLLLLLGLGKASALFLRQGLRASWARPRTSPASARPWLALLALLPRLSLGRAYTPSSPLGSTWLQRNCLQ
eukprot:3511506-Rhodomonas_salina.1